MRMKLFVAVSVVLLGGCDVAIKNGLFACGQPSDCPSGYHCWGSDNRCYDTKEPECERKSCEQVISDLGSIGIVVECGALPDGCDGSIDCGGCGAGETCGANGENFICGCEENTCATFPEGGAECGSVPTICRGDGDIFCGDCLNEEHECIDNHCVCPPGRNCDDACGGQCSDGEECVDGQCCTPTYPCAQNECSPPGGLPDGCGGIAQCPSCAEGQCVFGDELVYECVKDCTCESEEVECGNAPVCGSLTACGTCQDNGFPSGFRCQSGECICEDQFEDNDSFDTYALLCGGPSGNQNCMQAVWNLDIRASLHDSGDVDYYALEVLDAPTALIVQMSGALSSRAIQMTYLCPDGTPGMVDCSGYVDSIEDIEFCATTGNTLAVTRYCEKGLSGELGAVLIGIRSKEFRGECDGYDLRITSTYGPEVPTL